uniref:polycomb protein suz12-A-like n=1 Tax=Styela clava TaxID=7725 RepID=UPI00193A2A54|nr:polycomb protein suz12-A-like [Styela clava]
MPRQKKSEKNKKRGETIQDIQQDHEQFLLAFEKPTQIYRFLRARQILAPSFMHRNLLYMNERCSRTNARRNKFAVKDLLSVALKRESAYEQINGERNEDLHISVVGLSLDPAKHGFRFVQHNKKLKRVDVEVVLSRTILNKRKDMDFSAKETSYGVIEIPVNPRLNSEGIKADESSIIEIPASDFSRRNVLEGSIKSYSLIFRIREASSDSDESDDSESEDSADGSDNEQEDETSKAKKKKTNDSDEEEDEDDPAGISLKNLTSGPRKRKTRNVGLKKDGKKKDKTRECNTRSKDIKAETNKTEVKQKVHYFRNAKPPILKKYANISKDILFETELLAFNSDLECQAHEGGYELILNKKDIQKHDEYRRKAVWESFDGGKEVKVYGSFSSPTLILNLKWSACLNPGPLASNNSNEQEQEVELGGRRRRGVALTNGDKEISTLAVDKVEYRKSKSDQIIQSSNGFSNGLENSASIKRVFYQFMYNNNTRQQTESRDDFYCPWCQLNCMALYGLMKHLKLCHPRFLFRYSQQNRGTNIIVTINECYDGSYAGNPQTIFCQPGMAFSRRGPVRRIPVTDILVYKPERKPIDLSCGLAELLEREDVEALEPSQLSTGHRRLYFHSLTSLPVRPCEFDIDSEEEASEPDWLFGHTKRMIDEFTDVNEGEKALMKIWNLHVMRISCEILSDIQIEEECKRFIDKNITILSRHSLRRNLLLHFLCLVDFGVFKTSSVLALMDYYEEVEDNFRKSSANQENQNHAKELLSPDFPEPDLLPRLKQLKEIVSQSNTL